MTESFEAGLRELSARAAQAHAGGPGFPTAAMVGRARRNRRVRAAGVSVVTVAAVVGVAFAGVAAANRFGEPAPVPPAESTDPAPTTPTTTASVSPGPVEATGLLCGASIAEARPIDDAPVTVEAVLDAAAVPVDGMLTGSVVVAAVDAGSVQLDEALPGYVQFRVVQDGVVVGIARANGEDPVQPLSGRQGSSWSAVIPMTGCDAEGRTTGTVPAGDYELYGVLSVTVEGEPAATGLVLGGPWPFTVTDGSDETDGTDSTLPLQAPGQRFTGTGSITSAIPGTQRPLADGDYFGFLHGVDPIGATIEVELATFYGGQAAIDHIDAQGLDVENPPLNDYFIETTPGAPNPETLPLGPDVRIWAWCFGDDGLTTIERPLAEWAAAPDSGQTDCAAGSALSRSGPHWFDVRDGVVAQVVGQYLP